MTPSLATRRWLVLGVVLATSTGHLAHRAVTATPGAVERAAVVAAHRQTGPPGDTWKVSCQDLAGDRCACTVVWRQVRRSYADGPADYCIEQRVTVDRGRAGAVVLRGPDLRGC